MRLKYFRKPINLNEISIIECSIHLQFTARLTYVNDSANTNVFSLAYDGTASVCKMSFPNYGGEYNHCDSLYACAFKLFGETGKRESLDSAESPDAQNVFPLLYTSKRPDKSTKLNIVFRSR